MRSEIGLRPIRILDRFTPSLVRDDLSQLCSSPGVPEPNGR